MNETLGVAKSPAVAAFSRHRRVPVGWQAVLLVVTCLATGLAGWLNFRAARAAGTT